MSRYLRIGLVVRVPRSLRGVAASEIVVMLRTVVGNPDRRYVWTCPRFDTSGMLQLRVTDKNMSPRVIKGTGAPIRQCDGQRQPGGSPMGAPRLLNSRNQSITARSPLRLESVLLFRRQLGDADPRGRPHEGEEDGDPVGDRPGHVGQGGDSEGADHVGARRCPENSTVWSLLGDVLAGGG